jgi:hypothetical protein
MISEAALGEETLLLGTSFKCSTTLAQQALLLSVRIACYTTSFNKN